nr:G498 [uncultured bacterium]
MAFASQTNTLTDQPVIGHVEDFDTASGWWLERLLFNHRLWVLLICALVTGVLAWQAASLSLGAAYLKMVPAHHPYISKYLEHADALRGSANTVSIAVAQRAGTIYDAAYLDVLRRISDEVFLLPGIDRPFMKSLWTPATRWLAVTADGMEGGPVIPDDYAADAASVARVELNVRRSGEIGKLVANDLSSSIVHAPLLDFDPVTNGPLNYYDVYERLEYLRARYEQAGVDVHIIGFAQLMGVLIDGVREVLRFFLFTLLVASATVYWYTRCPRSTGIVVLCSVIAVVWQMGLSRLLGLNLNPYSVLVPFLVFAIGMSHGAQKMNGVMQDIGRGTHRLVAARYTFRRLFMPGLNGLLAEAAGFAVLLLIDVPVIRELSLTAALGVVILVFTNLMLVPVLLSYIGVNPSAAARAMERDRREAQLANKHPVWAALDVFTRPRPAAIALGVAALLAAGGWYLRADLRVGDIHPGAPELWPTALYNRDNAFITSHYSISSDVLIAMVETPVNECSRYPTLNKVDDLEWRLQQLPGVESVSTLATLTRRVIAGLNEGNLQWYELLRNQFMINTVVARGPRDLFSHDCSFLPVYVYLKNHEADTLANVVDLVEAFAAANNSEQVRFLLGAGNGGVEAATNIVVQSANRQMLVWVYGVVALLCLITFRSWRAVVCAVLPLMLTSVLVEALMAELQIGLKVATLPVVALGVGIGVDYALYILSVMLTLRKTGVSLSEAYYRTMLFTGRVVMLTGFTLAVGVVLWVLSPIKFQADMGLLLAFMFLWNMLGAMILLPALATFLLGDGTRRGRRLPDDK